MNFNTFENLLSITSQQLKEVEAEIKSHEQLLKELDQTEYVCFRNFITDISAVIKRNGLNCNSCFIQTPIKCYGDANFHYAFIVEQNSFGIVYVTIFSVSNKCGEILSDSDINKCANTFILKEQFTDFFEQLEDHSSAFYCEFMAMWEYAKKFIEDSFMTVALNDMTNMLVCAKDTLEDLEYSCEVVSERLRNEHGIDC